MSEGPLPRDVDLCPVHYEEGDATPGCCQWCDCCLELVRDGVFHRHVSECGRPSVQQFHDVEDVVELSAPVG